MSSGTAAMGDHAEPLPHPDLAETPSRVRVVLQIICIILTVAAGLWMLQRLERVAFVLVLAIWFAYVVAPFVQFAERSLRLGGRVRRPRRGLAIGLVYVFIAGVVSASAALLLPRVIDQIDDIVASAPAHTNAILAWEHGWSRYYERLRIPRELRQGIDESIVQVGTFAADYSRGSLLAVVGTLAYVPWLVLIPILGFFLLKDAASVRSTLVKALPFGGRLRSHRLFEDLNATLAAYMRAQLLACLVVGLLSGIGFALIGLPYAVLLGVLSGVLEFIPLVGPLALATVATMVGALHAKSLALAALAFLAVLRLVEDYVIYPRLLGRSVHLHPLAVIVVVLAGAELDGVAGMFLAVPVVAVGSVVFRHWLEWRVADGHARERAAQPAHPQVFPPA